jgi:drug/metabolite transporter (DMT)-like permease
MQLKNRESEIVFSAVLAHIYLNETLKTMEIFSALVIAIGIASLFAPTGRVKARASNLQRN